MEKWRLQCQNYYTGIAYSDAKKKKAGTGEAANHQLSTLKNENNPEVLLTCSLADSLTLKSILMLNNDSFSHRYPTCSLLAAVPARLLLPRENGSCQNCNESSLSLFRDWKEAHTFQRKSVTQSISE